MSPRREIELGISEGGSGVDVTVTKEGIYVGGWYDSFVGIEGRLIPWAEIDEARTFVASRRPMREWSASVHETT